MLDRTAQKEAKRNAWIEVAIKRVAELRAQQDKGVLHPSLSDELYRTEEALERFGIIA